MALNLMYITNQPQIAQIAEKNGVNRIFVDMEYIGKELRQGGMDTVQSHHTIQDIQEVRKVIQKSELLVRCNPIHLKTQYYEDSKSEIEQIIAAGADIIMLPYFKTVSEVETFIRIINGRVKTMLLVETSEAVEQVEEILKIPGIDEVFIGLNDLSLAYRKKFMFEILADGTVEGLCLKFKEAGIKYGFGGIARIGEGMLPAERIIKEHYRLGSTSVILSRSFCDTGKNIDIAEIKTVFEEEVLKIRNLEQQIQPYYNFFETNRLELINIVSKITGK